MLNELTAVGCGAILHAVRKGCPNLRRIHSNGTGLHDYILDKVLRGMQATEERAGASRIHYWVEDDWQANECSGEDFCCKH